MARPSSLSHPSHRNAVRRDHAASQVEYLLLVVLIALPLLTAVTLFARRQAAMLKDATDALAKGRPPAGTQTGSPGLTPDPTGGGPTAGGAGGAPAHPPDVGLGPRSVYSSGRVPAPPLPPPAGTGVTSLDQLVREAIANATVAAPGDVAPVTGQTTAAIRPPPTWEQSPLADVLRELDRQGIRTDPFKQLIDRGLVKIQEEGRLARWTGAMNPNAAASYVPKDQYFFKATIFFRTADKLNAQVDPQYAPKFLHELFHGYLDTASDPALTAAYRQQVAYQRQNVDPATYEDETHESIADEIGAHWLQNNLLAKLTGIHNEARDLDDALDRFNELWTPDGLKTDIGGEYVKDPGVKPIVPEYAREIARLMGFTPENTRQRLADLIAAVPESERAGRLSQRGRREYEQRVRDALTHAAGKPAAEAERILREAMVDAPLSTGERVTGRRVFNLVNPLASDGRHDPQTVGIAQRLMREAERAGR